MSVFLKINCCFILFFFLPACKKFLDVGNPPNKVAAEFVYNSNNTAAAVLTGLYFDLQKQGDGFAQGRTSISLYCGLAADEFNTLPLSRYISMYINANSGPYNFWATLYKLIYRINAAIEGLSASSHLSEKIKNQLKGEALFLRSFCYFYLVNLYGDVPLLVKSDYKENVHAKRQRREEIYSQIISDLIIAKSLLDTEYLGADASTAVHTRVRPSRWCAAALLSRVYLYVEDWESAEKESSELIDTKSLFDTTALDIVFNKDSKEAIWQLQPVSDDGRLNTLEAGLYTLINAKPNNSSNPVWLSPGLDSAFESGDLRRVLWVGESSSDGVVYHFFSKYKHYSLEDPYVENVMVLRLAEQYLIRAEARAMLNKIDLSLSDLNTLRDRVQLEPLFITDKDKLIEAILKERRIELCAEWGHRWFDLKRSGKIDEIMEGACILKGGTWEPYKQLFPIPLEDLKYNTNLVQNEGYPSF